MKYTKGTTGNPNGRPVGAKGKTPAELQKIFIQFLSKNINEMQNCFDQLKPAEKLEILYKFGKLVLPKSFEVEDKTPQKQAINIEVTNYQTAENLKKWFEGSDKDVTIKDGEPKTPLNPLYKASDEQVDAFMAGTGANSANSGISTPAPEPEPQPTPAQPARPPQQFGTYVINNLRKTRF